MEGTGYDAAAGFDLFELVEFDGPEVVLFLRVENIVSELDLLTEHHRI